MNVLDLFSGIGGFSLGLERAGMRTVAFCEIDPYCRAVLAKHWPNVPCYDDVRSLTAERLAADGIAADVICGGFPCQDISVAGKGAGIEGERSGLWSEYARIIGELRPRFVIVENVSALLSRGLDRVLGDLAALGYDAEWHCIPASAVGAPHRRDRLWLVAHPGRFNSEWRGSECGGPETAGPRDWSARPSEHAVDVAHAPRLQPGWQEQRSKRERIGAGGQSIDVADANQAGPQERLLWPGIQSAARCHDNGQDAALGGWWLPEPDVGRVAHGVPARVDRLKGLGNAVVPQIPEIIGRAIMKSFADITSRTGSSK